MKLYEILDGKRKEKMFSCIYLWTNLVNGKHYVGQTQHFYDRMKQYEKCGATPYLHNAIDKYGVENFDISILEYIPIDKLDEREQYWIDYYESYKKENGYNICQYASTTRGFRHSEESKRKMAENHPLVCLSGENNPMYGKHWSEERRQKHSEYLKSRWNEEEYRNFQSQRMSGENNYFYDKHLYGELNGMYGKKHSEETKRKISEKNKGKDNSRRIKIICVETGITYKSMSDAANKVGTYASAIKLTIDNPNRTCQGFHFKKIEE